MGNKKSTKQGEGNYDAAREYNERTAAFVKHPPASSPRPKSKAEADDLLKAERLGAARSRAGGQDQIDAKEMARLEKSSARPGAKLKH